MGKKRLIVFLIFLISIYAVQARYSVSIPFSVDSGGRPVSSAIVGINISEGTNCVSPFYFNKTTAQYGRGEINVTSSRFIAGRVYTMCFNSTVGSDTLRGKTRFSPGVGDINVSRWVNGSSSRFNTYQLNNGSTFDVIYGRQDGNATTIQIANIIYNGTGVKLVQAYNGTLLKQTTAYNGTLIKQITVYNNTLLKLTQGFNGTLLKLVNAYNSTLIKQVTVYNGTLLKVITAFNGTLIKQITVYNGTLLKNFNNTNRGKTYFNNSVFFNGTIQVRTYTLRNGSTFDVIYGARPDGNVTPIGITNIIYNGTGIKLIQAYNGTLLKKFNNTNRGKTYFNNTVFFNGTVEGRTFRLRNGTLFDVIYGRDTNNQTLASGLIKNNTAQGKAYLNSTLWPGPLRYKDWNISLDNNKDLYFYANSSYTYQSQNDALPYSRSGCTRISGPDGVGGNIPGSVHIGTECTQGWDGAYIDINDVNQNTSLNARLMQFFWNNKGPGQGIGLSMRLDSKHVNTFLQDLSFGYTGAGSVANTLSLMRFNIPSFTTNNSLPIGAVRIIDIATITLSTNSLDKLVGISHAPLITPNRVNGFAMAEIRRNSLTFTGQIVGLFVGNQPRNAAQSGTKYNRSYAVMSEGSPIQLSAGTPYIYNGPHFLNDNWFNASIGNVSTLYSYDKDTLVTQFSGRTSGLFNLTKMSKRQYNLTFAESVYINDTLKISGNATHADVKIDKTNFTIKSFNSTAYLNCAYFKSVNDATVKLICDGVAI